MKILLASPIHKDALEELSKNHTVVAAYDAGPDELKAKIEGCDALIFRSGVKITADVMSHAPNLRLILRAGSGIDNIDLDYVVQNGIQLFRIPGPGAKAVAELAFALMLSLARNVRQADNLLRQGHWAKHKMTGYLLTGKVLGVVGTGNIGSRVGQLGSAWGMQVIGCVEHYTEERAKEQLTHGIRLMSFDEVIAQSDFISLHVPKTPTTTHMINAETIRRMKPGAFLVNLARGGVVDEQALYQAMAAGHLAGAAMDVHEAEGEGKISPLAALDNVLLTPHIGAGTYDSQREIGEIMVARVNAFVAEEANAEPGKARVQPMPAYQIIG